MKILVVDDHVLVREGLSQVLKGLNVDVTVLQAGTCNQAFTLAFIHTDIELVLLDFHLPDMGGLEALELFGHKHPELPILMLSGSEDINLIRRVLHAGAAGFITKSSLSQELLDAVRQVLEGKVYCPKELSQATPIASSVAKVRELTQKQKQVLLGLMDGHSNKVIGEKLSVSEETIKSHVSAILRHLNVQNRTQAVAAASELGYRSSGVRGS